MGMSEKEMQEAQKLFEACMGQMNENPSDGTQNPFLLACTQMFKDFESISKEEPSSQGAPQGDDKFSSLLNSLAKDLMGDNPEG